MYSFRIRRWLLFILSSDPPLMFQTMSKERPQCAMINFEIDWFHGRDVARRCNGDLSLEMDLLLDHTLYGAGFEQEHELCEIEHVIHRGCSIVVRGWRKPHLKICRPVVIKIDVTWKERVRSMVDNWAGSWKISLPIRIEHRFGRHITSWYPCLQRGQRIPVVHMGFGTTGTHSRMNPNRCVCVLESSISTY